LPEYSGSSGFETVFIISASDESSSLTTGTGKAQLFFPFDFVLKRVVITASTAPTGATLDVDVNIGGASCVNNGLSISAGAYVQASSSLTHPDSGATVNSVQVESGSQLTVDIVQIGSSASGKGLKVTLYGARLTDR